MLGVEQGWPEPFYHPLCHGSVHSSFHLIGAHACHTGVQSSGSGSVWPRSRKLLSRPMVIGADQDPAQPVLARDILPKVATGCGVVITGNDVGELTATLSNSPNRRASLPAVSL